MRYLIFFIIFLTTTFAQNLPWDKSLIKGELKNGFKYTIKKNEKPKEYAELKLVVKVGSLEEDDDQKGIAHLVEHMHFNGTKNFKANEIIDFLESIGIEFGSHLNASTSTTRTQYDLTVPLKDGNLEKSFRVFKDWAQNVSFDETELEKEKGVVLEEARARNNASFRVYLQSLDTLYANSKYQHRIPIGDLDIVKNIKVDRVKAFYDDWYRPEYMHFIAVGDFDTSKIEKLIKKTFSDLKNNSKRQRASRNVPLVEKTRILFTHEKELTSNLLTYYFFKKYKRASNLKEYKEELIEDIALSLFNQTNSSLLTKQNPIAQRIGVNFRKIGDNNKAYVFSSSYQGMKEKLALDELVKSIYSIKRFGFNKHEFASLLTDLIEQNEEKFKTLENKSSSVYAKQLAYYELNDEIFVDEKFKYEFFKNELKNISLDDVNKAFLNIFDTKAQLIKFDLNTEHKLAKREVLSTIKKAKQSVKKAKPQKELPTKVLNKKLDETKIKDEKYNKQYDFWQFTLKNGAKVIFKQNDYLRNNVSLYSISFGGFSLIDDIVNARFTSNIIANSGLSKYTYKELNNIYAGKRLALKPYLSRYAEGFTGASSTKDFETLLEVLYLYHTEYKVDDNILKNSKSIAEYKLRQMKRDPKNRFSLDFVDFYYQGNKRFTKESIDDIKTVNKEAILDIYKDRFLDSNNFTYVIVGDIKYKELKRLASKYIANLPSQNRNETFKDRKIRPLTGLINFKKFYETKNISTIQLSYKTLSKYSLKEAINLSALKDVLNTKLRQLVREEKSGVYGISVRNSFKRIPYEEASLNITFTCDPNRKDELVSYVKQVIQELKTKKVEEKYIASFIKKRVIAFDERVKTAKFWEQALKQYVFFKDNINEVDKYKSYYQSVNPKMIKDLANKYFNGKNVVFAQLNPKSLEKSIDVK